MFASSFLLCLTALFPQEPAAEAGFRALAESVQFRQLDNGLRVIVLPRGSAPVVSFHLRVRVGGIDEAKGLTGLAHFAEHMAFKGSPRIGSLDWRAERPALEACDRAWKDYEAALMAQARGEGDPNQLAALAERFEQARVAADELSDIGAFDRAMEEAGGSDSNAWTAADSTAYFASLPANRMETWFWLAREMIGAPVMREFYKERDVVMEERRQRTDSSAFGAMLEAITSMAFVAHPYRDSTIGHMDDLELVDRPEMIDFWLRHYTADRIVLAIVGRVDAEQTFRYAEKYLGDLPTSTQPRPRRTAEPEQTGGRRVELVRPAARLLMTAWKTPALRGRERHVYDALAQVLFGGESSRLHTRLVSEQGAAAEVSGTTGYPGRIDPNLFLVYARPTPGNTLESLLETIQGEVRKLAEAGPTARELEGVVNRQKMALIDSLEDNGGLAEALAEAEAEDGGWEKVFTALEELSRITPEEIAAAAAQLVPQKRTVAILKPADREID